jgi:hypothetical protein
MPFHPIAWLSTDATVQRLQSAGIAKLRDAAWMAGTWNAHEKVDGPGRVRDLGIATYIIADTMRGRWIFGSDGKSREFFYLTFDPLAGQWVLAKIEAASAYALLTSRSGWNNGRIVFTGQAAYTYGVGYRKRTTIIRLNPKEFAVYDEQAAPDGKFAPVDEYDFRRVQ